MADSPFITQWVLAQPAVANYLAAICPDRVLCDEALQDTAVTCFQRYDKYDQSRPFTPWAIGIARLCLKDLRRRHQRARLRLSDDVESLLAAQIADTPPDAVSARSDALRQCVSQLGNRARTALSLRYTEGLPLADVAERLDTSHGATRTLISRLHRKLHDCITTRLAQQGHHD